MSMNHKAFLLDYQGFQTELKPTIEYALITGNCAAIHRFIAKNLSQLMDPCDGEPLSDDWERLLEAHDVHHYGDVALTRFYSPRLDLGVGDAWLEVDRYIRVETGTSMILLGCPIGVQEPYFDPGKLGAYVQSPHDCRRTLTAIRLLKFSLPGDIEPAFSAYTRLLNDAVSTGHGLYITF